ncbi:MAG: thiamine phosphate synthase [Akkermansia sp.]|nr:thiamine phosphate synthase [Akkermansia sp.]
MNKLARLKNCHLYGILDLGYTPQENIIPVTLALLDGGIGILQLRAKHHTPEQIETMAKQIAPLCQEKNCLFIINDYPEIAKRVGADGVHIGQDDGNLAEIRQFLGNDIIIGRSTHSYEQAINAYKEAADYIGFGPLYPTGTKPGRPAIGLDDIARVHRELPQEFPIYCIGGVNSATLPQVLSAGARRVVIVSWLLTQPDISASTLQIRQQLGEA